MWSPTSLPYFFRTSRRFMLRGRTQPTTGPLQTAVELDRRGAKERVSLPPVPQRLKHQTEMLLVVEVPEEAEAVELVVGVGVVQLLEELQLFQPGLLPVDRKQSRVAHQRTSNICRGGAVQTIDTRLDTKRLNPRGNVFSHKKKEEKGGTTHMSSLLRMILTATSWPALAVSRALITLLKTPWPV